MLVLWYRSSRPVARALPRPPQLSFAVAFSPRVQEVALAAEVPQESGMPKKVPNPVDKHVGSRVRMRRMMLGMSQEKLARRSA